MYIDTCLIIPNHIVIYMITLCFPRPNVKSGTKHLEVNV